MIQLKKVPFKIIEANKYEVAIENEEVVIDMDVGEVGGPMMTITTTSKEEKVQQEVVGEATLDQIITSHTLNVAIAKILVITLPSVEHLSV